MFACRRRSASFALPMSMGERFLAIADTILSNEGLHQVPAGWGGELVSRAGICANSLVRTYMRTSEFVLQGGHPYSFTWWSWKNKIPSHLGDFELEIRNGDDNCLGEELIVHAQSFVSLFAELNDSVLQTIHEHYRVSVLDTPSWFAELGIPCDLTAQKLQPFIRDRSLVLDFVPGNPSPVRSDIYITPLWEVEHSVSLAVENGRIASLNGEPFELVRGKIIYTDR
jgi:hypothetical protein